MTIDQANLCRAGFVLANGDQSAQFRPMQTAANARNSAHDHGVREEGAFRKGMGTKFMEPVENDAEVYSND